MDVRLFKANAETLETLRPIVESWRDIASQNKVGIIVEDVNKFLFDLFNLATGEMSDLLVLYDGETPVGIFGLQYCDSLYLQLLAMMQWQTY